MHKAHGPERSTFEVLLSCWRETSFWKREILPSPWCLRSGVIGEAPAASLQTCRPFYFTAEVLRGWQGRGSESAAVVPERDATLSECHSVRECCHCILDSAGKALRESQLSPTGGGTRSLTLLQPELAGTSTMAALCNSSSNHLVRQASCWQQKMCMASRCSDINGLFCYSPSRSISYIPVTGQSSNSVENYRMLV